MKGEMCICPATWKKIKAMIKTFPAGRVILRTLRKGGKRVTTRKRRFSRKQLAAQRLFAKRAKAGTLRRGRSRNRLRRR